MKQSITPQIALVSQSTAGRRLFALGIISIIAVATRTRTRTPSRSRSRSNRLHFAARACRVGDAFDAPDHGGAGLMSQRNRCRRRGWAKGLRQGGKADSARCESRLYRHR